MSLNDKRIGLIGFNRATAKTFETEGLKIASHIYANDNQKKKNTETNPEFMNFHHWKSYNLIDDYGYSAPVDIIAKAKEQYLSEFIRCTDRWPWSAQLINNWNDYDHLFKLACDHSYGWLKHHKIDCVVYANVPHQGLAIVQYAIAKLLDVKTLIFTQSSFPGRSWLVEDWKDIGLFETSVSSGAYEVDITPPTAQPFYMNSVKSNNKRKMKNHLQKIKAQVISTLGLTGFEPEERRFTLKRNIKRWLLAIENKRYFTKAENLFLEKDINESYVYFPLHLQPEMTTDVLGGEYADQVHALETLREIVPEDIPIFIKENPKQTGILRSDSFFSRIEKISNIKFIAPDASSLELIKNSIATATITGTAGWEALRMGKPAIVFGHIFWKHLPGAFHISQSIDWNTIQNYKYDKEKLQVAANELGAHAHESICDLAYIAQVNNFDETENAIMLAKTIQLYL